MSNVEKIDVAVPEADEEPQWQELYMGYADFYHMPMNNEILNTVWGWIRDRDNPFCCIVAKDCDARLTGFMHFRAMPSPLRGAMVGFLDDLFVRPEARGKGVVTALYRELEQQGKQKGWPLIRWITAENNYRARALYDQLADKTHWVTYQLDIR